MAALTPVRLAAMLEQIEVNELKRVGPGGFINPRMDRINAVREVRWALDIIFDLPWVRIDEASVFAQVPVSQDTVGLIERALASYGRQDT